MHNGTFPPRRSPTLGSSMDCSQRSRLHCVSLSHSVLVSSMSPISLDSARTSTFYAASTFSFQVRPLMILRIRAILGIDVAPLLLCSIGRLSQVCAFRASHSFCDDALSCSAVLLPIVFVSVSRRRCVGRLCGRTLCAFSTYSATTRYLGSFARESFIGASIYVPHSDGALLCALGIASLFG